MSTQDEINALRAQADALEAVAAAEVALEKATEAYRNTQTEAKRQAYKDASVALAEARAAARADRPATGVGGDATSDEEAPRSSRTRKG